MADRAFTATVKAMGGRVRVLGFSALVSGASATAAASPLLESVTHPATGVFRFTLKDMYWKPIFATAHYVSSVNNEDLYAQITQDFVTNFIYVGGTAPPVIDVQLKTGAVNTDPGTGFVMLLIYVEDSSAF